MKKIISLLALMMMLQWAFAPLYIYAADTAADQQLADLLAELEWSDAQETPKEEAPAPEVVEEKTEWQEEHEAAEDILDSIEGDQWAFAWPQKIEVSDIKDGMVTISTTEVLFDWASVNKYNIFYSQSTLSDVSNFDSIQSKEVNVDNRKGNMAYLTLTGLTPETKYYVTVTPVHPTDPTVDWLKMTSSEVTFSTAANAPKITPTTKVFENVSFTQNKNTITVTWTPTNIVKNGSLQVRHKDESNYVKVGTVSMNTGKYTFTVNKSGSYFLKLHWVSNEWDTLWQEQVQNIKIESFDQPEAPVQSAPQVGPTTDLIMMLLVLAMVIYFIYRFRRIER